MLMPGRQYTANSTTYRYGFNGKENDNDVKGVGNQLDFGSRIYDSRLGRFLSIDPRASQYPFESNYVFAENNPIYYIDIDGEGPGLPPLFDPSRRFEILVKKYDDILYDAFITSHNSSLSHLQKSAWASKYGWKTSNLNIIGVIGEAVFLGRLKRDINNIHQQSYLENSKTGQVNGIEAYVYSQAATRFYHSPDKFTDVEMVINNTRQSVFKMDLYVATDFQGTTTINTKTWKGTKDIIFEVKTVSPNNAGLLDIVEKGLDQLLTNSKVRSGGVPILVLDSKAWDAISNIGNEFIPIPSQMYQKQSIMMKLFEVQKLGGGLLLENGLNQEAAKKMNDIQTIIKNQTDDPGKNYYQNN